MVVSPLEDLTKGNFQEIIDDKYVTATKVERVLLCSGKVYYDLYDHQQKDKRKDVAIVRLEQLYPFPEKQLEKVVKRYKSAKEIVWVQEEPNNAGAWGFILRMLHKKMDKLDVISREESASPAVGYLNLHKEKQAEIVRKAFETKS